MERKSYLVEIDGLERCGFLSAMWVAGAELIVLLGEINGFVQLPASSTDLPPGNSTTQITKLNIHTNGTDSKFLYYSPPSPVPAVC